MNDVSKSVQNVRGFIDFPFENSICSSKAAPGKQKQSSLNVISDQSDILSESASTVIDCFNRQKDDLDHTKTFNENVGDLSHIHNR